MMMNQNIPNDGQVGKKAFKDTQRVKYVPAEEDDSVRKVSPGRIDKQSGSNRLERAVSKSGEKIDQQALNTRQQISDVVNNSNSKFERLPPHRFLPDLKEMPEGREKEAAMKAVYRLMKENQFESVPPEERAWKGCIFHVPKDLDELRQRVANSKIFLVMIREPDGRVMGFTEFTGKRVLKLYKSERIRHPQTRRLEAVIKYSEQNKVLHEQLIVADQSLQIKGIGTALLIEAFERAKKMGAVLVTTEVQGIPPNNKSMQFHSRTMGYCDFATIKEHPEGMHEINFVLYARPLNEDVATELHGDTPMPTPTVGL